jgi:glycerol-3-phosphate dehydrogenase
MPPRLIELQGNDYDVVVIGAGINGAGAARELAGAGYSVLLVDRSDFAAGASGRSSRILHCGLRYFETTNPVRTFALHPQRLVGAIAMARTAMEAREELTGLAPERCNPITMCFPIYPESRVRGWHLDMAFTSLRWCGPARPPLDYRRLKRRLETHLPFVSDLRDRNRLSSIATYREYIIDWPERLCVDAALDAEDLGATISLFNQARISRREDDAWIVELEGRDSGEFAEVRAKVVLDMAGSWIDTVAAGPRTGELVGSGPKLVRGTKGAHIVVRLPETYRGFGITCLHRGGMPFYCLPSHDDYYFLGPTETQFDGDATDVAASNADIDFLVAEAKFILPGLNLARRDVEFTWAGVRPLTFDADQPLGRRTRQIHDLGNRGMPGVFAMTAGPVMSYLSGAREMRRIVEKYLQLSLGARPPMSPSRNPGRHTLKSRSTFGIERPPGQEKRAAFREAVSAEHARDLRGILYTRTGLAWRRHLRPEEVDEVASSVADIAGWPPERTKREVDEFIRFQQTVFCTDSKARQPGMGDIEA